jgi:HK97 family phage prohead protease
MADNKALGLNVPFDFPITVQKQYIVKSDDGTEDKWYIEGYAATSDFDLQGDIISQECLKKSETQLLDNSTVLWNHKEDFPIGRVVESELDENGLKLKILISKTAEDKWLQIQEGVLNKFSISAKVIKAAKKFVKEIGTIANVIDEMFLLEVSLVSVPANPQAKAIGWYVGKALSKYEKEGGVIAMSEALATVHKSDEAQIDPEVKTEEVKTEEVKTEEVKVEETKTEDVKVTDPEADTKKSAPAPTMATNSLDASGSGPANAATVPNPTANAGVTPTPGFDTQNGGVTQGSGTNNATEPAKPAPGFKKGLGWILSDLEYMLEALEYPENGAVPKTVTDAIRAAITALSPAAGQAAEVEEAIEAAVEGVIGKDATKVEAKVEKAAELTPEQQEIAALKKSNESLVASVALLQKNMPVTRKGLIRNDGPTLTEADSKREAVKTAGDPEARLRKAIEVGMV